MRFKRKNPKADQGLITREQAASPWKVEMKGRNEDLNKSKSRGLKSSYQKYNSRSSYVQMEKTERIINSGRLSVKKTERLAQEEQPAKHTKTTNKSSLKYLRSQIPSRGFAE